MATTTRRYADSLLPKGGVAAFIAKRRNTDKPASWYAIALDLHSATDGEIKVTPQTLRAWAAEDTAGAA